MKDGRCNETKIKKRRKPMRKEWIYLLAIFVMTLSAPIWAEEITLDQKVDQLWNQSERIQFGAYVQTQYYSDQSSGIPNGTGDSGLFMRRVDLIVKGKLLSDLSYLVDVSVGLSTDPLLDAYADWTRFETASLRLGQYRIPFGIETQTSSRKLYFIDRMLLTNPDTEQASSKAVSSIKSGFIQERDLGLRISGKLLTAPIGLDYMVAVINGSDRNTADKNDKKDIVGRIGISPLKILTVGGSAYIGKSPQTLTAAGATTFSGLNVKRDRYGADLEIHPFTPMIVRAEYVTGKDDTVKFNGYYLFIAYRFPMDVEPAVRLERLDPNKETPNNEVTRTTIGVNYYIKGDTKVQVNYEFRDDKGSSKVGNIALAQLQLSF
jgi:hypothetical protein